MVKLKQDVRKFNKKKMLISTQRSTNYQNNEIEERINKLRVFPEMLGKDDHFSGKMRTSLNRFRVP
jgi:hypothetical protein